LTGPNVQKGSDSVRQIRIGEPKEGMIIQPELHSQFIEFLGSCIHDGIWVGRNSEIPNYGGLRKDAVDALRAIAPPVIRWPGGCYADMYHCSNFPLEKCCNSRWFLAQQVIF